MCAEPFNELRRVRPSGHKIASCELALSTWCLKYKGSSVPMHFYLLIEKDDGYFSAALLIYVSGT